MEICYYWIDKFDVIEKQGYNFGSQLIFDYKDNVLTISENKLYIEGFFNLDNKNRIKNITAICGENGVGKSTFLRALKVLLKEGGIRPLHNEWNVYNKCILVIKLAEEYRVIFYQDLFSLKEVKYESKEIENKYGGKIKFIDYGENQNTHTYLNNSKKELLRVNGTEVISDTSCIYLSHSFDNNFYYDFTEAERNYFDVSTKGILNKIEEDLKPLSSLSRQQAKANHLNFKDERFNVGLLKEFYISETKKRINLLEDDKSREIIKSHNFFPKKVKLNLDYLIYRENIYNINEVPTSQLLRSEGREQNLNKIEKKIKRYIENLNNSSSKPFNVVKQTYFRRIVDSYFNDAERLLFFKLEDIKDSFEIENDIEVGNDDEFKIILNRFHSIAEEEIKKISKSKEHSNINFNEEEFRKLTKSYIDFIDFFNKELLIESPVINFEDDKIEISRTTNDATRKSKPRPIRTIEISLESKAESNVVPEGIQLLQKIIKAYNSIYTTSNFLKMQWDGLSTGEDTILSIYSRLFDLKAYGLKKNIIILLDEIEHSLHPEWQRSILDNLIGYLPDVFPECESIQIVLATNVPFLIADIPTRNVVYLEKKKNKDNKEAKVEAKTSVDTSGELDDKKKFINQTFAANIHSLLMNNFFMQSTLGKLSERKIRNIIDILNTKSKDKNTSKDKLVKDGKYYSPEEISTTIQTIGEPIIRNKLESMYEKKFGEDIREIEIKKLISEFKESENEIPDKFKNLLNDILIKSSKDYKK